MKLASNEDGTLTTLRFAVSYIHMYNHTDDSHRDGSFSGELRRPVGGGSKPHIPLRSLPIHQFPIGLSMCLSVHLGIRHRTTGLSHLRSKVKPVSQ